MRKNRVLVVLGAVLLAISSVRCAQSAGESDLLAIEAAVASRLRPSLPASGVAFDPRVQTDHGWIAARSPERVAALSAQLHAPAVASDTILVCASRTPSSCTLRNTTTLLVFSEPVIHADTAVVRISRWDRTRFPRIPISRQDLELHLQRRGSHWAVVSKRVTGMT